MSRSKVASRASRIITGAWFAIVPCPLAGCGSSVDQWPDIEIRLSFRYLPKRVEIEVIDGQTGEIDVDSGPPLRLRYPGGYGLFIRCEQVSFLEAECRVSVDGPAYDDTCADGPAFRVSTDVNPNPFLVSNWCPNYQRIVIP